MVQIRAVPVFVSYPEECMITGFKLRVTSGELKTHLRERAAYHRRRADEKGAELPGLRDAMERLKKNAAGAATNLAHMNKTSNYRMDPDDPVENLETDIKDHQNKAMVFEFYAEHLFDEDYTLDRNDLVSLEIVRA